MKKQITAFILLLLSIYLLADPIMWTKTYGTDYPDAVYSIKQTFDEGYVAGGYISEAWSPTWTRSYPWVLKLNKYGDTLWTQKLGDMYIDGSGEDIIQTSDSGFVVAGYGEPHYSKDAVIWKLDKNGNTSWIKSYGYNDNMRAYGIKQTQDYGYIVSGLISHVSQTQSIFLLKLNTNGDSLWQKEYFYQNGGSWSKNSILETKSGDFIFAGKTNVSGVYTMLFMKLNSFGDTLWTKQFNSAVSSLALSIVEANDTSFVATGSNSLDPGSGLAIVNISIGGNIIWEKNYAKSLKDGFSIDKINDEGFIIAGYYDGNFYLLKIDNDGEFVWDRSIDFPNCYSSKAFSVQTTSDNGFVVSGKINSENTMSDAIILKLDKNGDGVGIHDNNELSIMNYELKQNYPNPFNPTTTISYKLPNINYKSAKLLIYNTLGQNIWQSKPLHQNSNQCQFDGSKFNSGIYYYSLVVDNKKLETRKMILVK